MSLTSAEDIIRRWEKLAEDRVNFESVWQEIADHIKGRRDFTTKPVLQGRKRNAIIYDNTAMLSGDMLASALHNFLTNTATQWFGIKPENEILLEDDDVRFWYDYAYRVMNAVFNRPESRFVPAMHEIYIDIVHWCTSVMFVEDVPGIPVRFSARPLAEFYVSEDYSGKIDTVYRHYELTHKQAVQKFGKENVPEAAKKVEDDPEGKYEYLHLVHRRDDVSGQRSGKPIRDTFKPWRSVNVSLQDREIVKKGGFYEMPYLISRWEKEAGETYGRGPGWNALPEAKMLNVMSKTLIKAAQKVTDPPLMVSDDDVLYPLQTQPGGTNVVRASAFATDPIKTLPIEPNIPIGVDILERRKTAVRGAYMHDLLQILQDPRMTATQVIEISERAQALIAPILGRLQIELLEPMIERVFGILIRSEMLPPPPPLLEGTNITVEYISPVARAQRSSEIRSLTNTMGIAAQLATIDPSVLDIIDFDEGMRLVALNAGTPARLTRSRAQVDRMRRVRAEVAQQNRQQEEALAMAEVVKRAGPTAVKAIENVQGLLTGGGNAGGA